MEAVEFGKDNRRKIMLIPGNMMSWRQFERVIPLLEKDFHVVAVSTDGYDGSGKTTFTTAEASAEKLEAYIRDRLDGQVDLVFGHGEIIAHPELMAAEIRRFIGGDRP